MPAREVLGRDDCILFAIVGALDSLGVHSFEQRIREAVKDGIRHILFDCSRMTYCNGLGLGSLVAIADNHEKTGRGLALFALRPHMEVVFEMLVVDPVFRLV